MFCTLICEGITLNILSVISDFIGNCFSKIPLILILYFIAVNIVSMSMFYIDKKRAVRHQWRISEATLLTSAFVGGSFGAAAGMKMFRHKTKHPKFYILVPLFMILHAMIIVLGIIGIAGK